MWTDTTRAQYVRADLALPSDLTYAEWALLQRFPGTLPCGKATQMGASADCRRNPVSAEGQTAWLMLPPCFPPVSTVRRWLYLRRDNALWLLLNHAPLLIGREAGGREASPSAGVIDSQSVKTTESGGPCGYDAGKKTKERKQHIVTDTDGNFVHAVIQTADVQDSDGAPLVLAEIIRCHPWLRHVFSYGGYAGEKLRKALRKIAKWTVEIIKRSDHAKGFEVLRRRWVVERTFARLDRNRRRTKDFEQAIASATTSLFIVHRLNPTLRMLHPKRMKSIPIFLNQTLIKISQSNKPTFCKLEGNGISHFPNKSLYHRYNNL